VDEALVDGEAYYCGEEAFCDAVGHVDSCGFAPFGYDVTFIDDEAGWFASFLEGADAVVEGFATEAFGLGELLVAWGFCFVVAGEGFGLREFYGVEAEGGGGAVLPLAAGREVVCGFGWRWGWLCWQRIFWIELEG